MRDNGRAALFSVLTYVMLGATACLVVFYTLVGFNVFNPFPPPTLISVAMLPTDTPATIGPTDIPTWTPTNTPTITPTPGPTNTPTITLTPSATPTFPPTRTPTPRVTRSPWPFTYEVEFMMPPFGCGWTGVAGHVQDLDGNPLIGYPVHVWGAVEGTPMSGLDPGINTRYGNDAAWEQYFDNHPKPMAVRVRLYDNQGRPLSEEIVIDMPGYCSAALAYVVFTQNH
ncbi:MAG: hypothetical protein ACE5OS_04350 [Anaerolineae bacterium]